MKRLHPDAILPTYAHPGDVGMDVYSREERTLAPGERHNFMLGFAVEFDAGYSFIAKDKSSMSKLFGIHILGGVYDAGYRGEYNVCLINLSDQPVTIEKKQKIAQFLLVPVVIPTIIETETLSDSSRGTGAFGSTGKF